MASLLIGGHGGFLTDVGDAKVRCRYLPAADGSLHKGMAFPDTFGDVI
jgi:hypothetical protein